MPNIKPSLNKKKVLYVTRILDLHSITYNDANRDPHLN